MKVDLTVDAVQWVEAEIAAGTFATPEDAVHFAVSQARAKRDLAFAEEGRSQTLKVQTAPESAVPKRTAQEAAARMLNRRQFHRLPEGKTIRDMITYGRA